MSFYFVDRGSWKSDFTSSLRNFVIFFLNNFGIVKTNKQTKQKFEDSCRRTECTLRYDMAVSFSGSGTENCCLHMKCLPWTLYIEYLVPSQWCSFWRF